MLADCTGTHHEVHKSYNRNIAKTVHQRTGERHIKSNVIIKDTAKTSSFEEKLPEKMKNVKKKVLVIC